MTYRSHFDPLLVLFGRDVANHRQNKYRYGISPLLIKDTGKIFLMLELAKQFLLEN